MMFSMNCVLLLVQTCSQVLYKSINKSIGNVQNKRKRVWVMAEDSHPYVQNFIPDTVAAFWLLFNRKPCGAAAGGVFYDASNLKDIQQT